MRLLVANFFPAFFPPSSGGEQRYYLYRHLSRWHDVTLFSATYADRPEEVIHHTGSFREYRIPKPAVSSHLHHDLHSAGIGDECSAFVVALTGAVDSALRTRFGELAQFADVVIHESPFTFPLDVTAHVDRKPRVYASYNVEHDLSQQMLEGPAGVSASRFIHFLEGELLETAQLVFATSEEDRASFARRLPAASSKLRLLPNGFEPPAGSTAPPPESLPYVVFIGSAHPPNVEAARFICDTLAEQARGLEFRIIGSVCARLTERIPENVKLLGFVDEDEMRRELAGCSAALNPLFSGSGTNLKMLQYMEAGAPILADESIGARGLRLEPEVEAVICESGEFAARLAGLEGDPGRWRGIGQAAKRRAYAEYSWDRIADGYRKDLEPLAQDIRRAGRKGVVAVNDFTVHARRGGGEARIYELLRELAIDFDVELLCLTDEEQGSEVRLAPWARQRAFPKSSEHLTAQLLADAREPMSVRDILAAQWVLRNDDFVSQFIEAASRAEVVIFEHPYLAPLVELLPPHVKVIYSALNVEEDLKRQTLASRSDGDVWAARAAELERGLAARADAIVAVSEEDARVFSARHADKAVVVIENGVTEHGSIRPLDDAGHAERRDVVFLGSAHPPNVDAAEFIICELAAQLPDIRFHLIGSVCHAVSTSEVASNVIRHGIVDDEQKRAILRSCAVAINPMRWGGGST